MAATKTNGTKSAAAVSDALLATFDRVSNEGQTLPLAEIKKRYAASSHFNEYNDYDIYDPVITLNLTVEMVTGAQRANVEKIIDGLRGIYGDELLRDLSERAPTLRIRTWKPEDKLRAAWKSFAEHEYGNRVLGGES